MRTVLLTLLAFTLSNLSMAQQRYAPLDLIGIHQLQTSDSLQFDLSGIVATGGNYYVIGDKHWNKSLYQVTFADSLFSISKTPAFSIPSNPDLEAIDYYEGLFYLASEKDGKVYTLDRQVLTHSTNAKEMLIDFESAGLTPSKWGNAGWEGLALDSENQTLYLCKERQPRWIVAINLNSGAINQFNIPETESNDFSDAKFENGFLYVLERNGNYITKIDPVSQQVTDKVSYHHIASHPDGKLYGPEKYGMAEALLLTEDEIWIGLDNNGKSVTEHAKNTHKLSGKTPVILKFRRPKGF
ncbi:SdiA-regulated domain-containing protein [Gilvimarinus agarilyticus]|uniref:SdiA-regulated domain-containing protein n=1 Tax=Reichenbachiella agariperforans TaxID=156994 RepID=UPI001C082010|nr:SdiA-regulated domain-containing protein [Reichenbachiella agariperforans]MBU2885878.1 SdiA-regulated domain-containing protein [Gilvimarinus agarilyticus]MBU2915261.1 SdiA-regulated domain-containing protein [Reichenbachiella agariperforans]